jgi:hypothetical protein
MHHYKVIACKILQRQLAYVLPSCPNALDITFLRQDLHDTPRLLTKALQEEIDAIESGCCQHTNRERTYPLEAILLGYGLCSNALVGLKSRRLPLVIPRAHDCTTLFMGSKERYSAYFHETKGSFFYTRSWLELGAAPEASGLERKRIEYMDKFQDEDTVDYLMEMEEAMLKQYQSITYISWPGMEDGWGLQEAARIARERSWQLHTYPGSPSLLSAFVNGSWKEEDFLLLQPGERLTPSYDDSILTKASE